MDSILSLIVRDNKRTKFDDCEEVVAEYTGDESSVNEVKVDDEQIPVIDFDDQTLQKMFETDTDAQLLDCLKDMVREIHCEWPFPDSFTPFEELEREVRRLKQENETLHKRIAELEAKCVSFNPNRGDRI